MVEPPEVPRQSADAAWRDYGEVILCDTDEEKVKELQITLLKEFQN